MKHESENMEDIIVDSAKAEKVVAIAKQVKQYKRTFQNRIYDWFVFKGWIYLMVFIMGVLTGGLIWK